MADKLYFLRIVFQRVADVADAVLHIVREYGMERNSEERVQRLAADVDSCNAGGGKNDIFLSRRLGDMFQERRFPRSCLSGQEQGVSCPLNDAERILKHLVRMVYVFLHGHGVVCRTPSR